MITIEVLTALGRQYQKFAWTGSCTPYGTKRMVAAAQKELKAALGDIASRMMFMTVERATTLARLTQLFPGDFLDPTHDGCGLIWYAPLVFDRTKPEAVAAAATCYQELLLTGRAKEWFPYRAGINTKPTLIGM